MARDFRIEIKVEGSREQAISWLSEEIEFIRRQGWPLGTAYGGGGAGNSVSYSVFIGPRPLNLEERVAKLEGK